MLKFSILTGLVLLAGSALAQSSAGSVHVQAERPAAVVRDDLRAVQGEYAFEGGRVLTVSQSGRRVLAHVEAVGTVELVPLSPTRYESRDGRVKLAFDATPNGSVHAVTMTLRRPG